MKSVWSRSFSAKETKRLPRTMSYILSSIKGELRLNSSPKINKEFTQLIDLWLYSSDLLALPGCIFLCKQDWNHWSSGAQFFLYFCIFCVTEQQQDWNHDFIYWSSRQTRWCTLIFCNSVFSFFHSVFCISVCSVSFTDRLVRLVGAQLFSVFLYFVFLYVLCHWAGLKSWLHLLIVSSDSSVHNYFPIPRSALRDKST